MIYNDNTFVTPSWKGGCYTYVYVRLIRHICYVCLCLSSAGYPDYISHPNIHRASHSEHVHETNMVSGRGMRGFTV